MKAFVSSSKQVLRKKAEKMFSNKFKLALDGDENSMDNPSLDVAHDIRKTQSTDFTFS